MRYRSPATNYELYDLARYLEGLADGLAINGLSPPASKIGSAAQWIDKLAPMVCGGGIVGCRGGPNCGSDHK